MANIIELNRTEYLSDDMANKNYTILVEQYMFGQLRIKLTDIRHRDPYAPKGHGGIVRELDTYYSSTAAATCMNLSEAEDPERWCIEQERDWNCEMSGDGPLAGDRIRLDETQESNPYRRCTVQDFTPKAYPINIPGVKRQTRGKKELKEQV